MSSRPQPPTPASPHADPDLEKTAELPTLDATALGLETEDDTVRLDTRGSPAAGASPGAGTAGTAAPAATTPAATAPAAAPVAAAPARESTSATGRAPAATAARESPPGGGERLARVERERDAARAALAATEQRLGAAAEEVAQARALVSSSGERTLELQRRLELAERERRESEPQAAAHAAAHAAALAEILAQRSRAASYFEALQSAEGRRLITEGLIGDLQREAAARDADLGRLTHELAARDSAARDRNAELEQRAAHTARLEQQLGALNTALAGRETLLRDAQQATEGLQTSVTRLQGEIATGAERMRALEALAAQFRDTESQRRRELEQLLAEREQLSTQLESALATARAASAAAAQPAPPPAAEASSAGASAERLTELEVALVAKHQRIAQLEGELTKLRAEMTEWGGVLHTAQEERAQHLAGVAAAEARAQALQRDVTERSEAIRQLQVQSDAHAARARELEANLAASENAVNRLEAEVRTRGLRIEELEKSNSHWRATLEETRLGSTDPRLRRVFAHPPAEAARPEPQGAKVEPLAATAEPLVAKAEPLATKGEPLAASVEPLTARPEPLSPRPELLAERAACVLIQTRRGREITHVLGRKTSIGRTPDNDLQLDAKVISRHHAVILVGPVDTVIEDLNSTNGVLVNGRRITRHILMDGDQVVIGRERYRFAVRKPDKR